MQRKAYVTGVAALLVALLAGCTGGSGDGGTTDDSNPGEAGTASAAAQPGKYRTLPEPCSAVGHDTLDSLLPGIRQITDEAQRAIAVEKLDTIAEPPRHGLPGVEVDGTHVRARLQRAGRAIPGLLRDLDRSSITLDSIEVHRPTLDDVFLTLTGRSLRESETAQNAEKFPAQNADERTEETA